MKQRTIIIGLMSLFLFSCGGSTMPSTEQISEITTSTYSVAIFPGWTTDESLSTNTQEVYVSPSPKDGIFSSLSIVREELLSPQTSTEYAEMNITAAKRDVRDYLPISTTPIEIDGIPSLLHIFDGRSSEQAVRKRFVQTYITDGQTKAFTISFAISPNTDDTSAYSQLLQSFSMK